METIVGYIIFFYMFICLALLIFNFTYIFSENKRNKNRARKARKWEKYLRKRIVELSDTYIDTLSDPKLERELVKFNSLIAFDDALDVLNEEFTKEQMQSFYECLYMVFQSVVYSYKNKDSMERAYVAYLISKYRPCRGEVYRPIMEYLISYFDNSTVYCRENVLNALYSLGNMQAVESAFQIINDRKLFHHQKLLSDGLMQYTGDKEELAIRLWGHFGEWDSNLIISVIQFINNVSDKFSPEFLEVIKDKGVDLDIRLAALRYFRKHYYEPACEVIVNILEGGYVSDDKEEANVTLSIVAASVLENYRNDKTTEVLTQALSSQNWYVRYNAAASLMAAALSEEAEESIINGEDRYAAEILRYMQQLKKTHQAGLAGGK